MAILVLFWDTNLLVVLTITADSLMKTEKNLTGGHLVLKSNIIIVLIALLITIIHTR